MGRQVAQKFTHGLVNFCGNFHCIIFPHAPNNCPWVSEDADYLITPDFHPLNFSKQRTCLTPAVGQVRRESYFPNWKIHLSCREWIRITRCFVLFLSSDVLIYYYSFCIQEISPRGKRRLEFQQEQRKEPLKGCTFYLDLENYRKTSSLKLRIKDLGGV